MWGTQMFGPVAPLLYSRWRSPTINTIYFQFKLALLKTSVYIAKACHKKTFQNGEVYTVGGGTAFVCKQSCVTLYCYVHVITVYRA